MKTVDEILSEHFWYTNSEKHLDQKGAKAALYALSLEIIGEDDWKGCSLFDEFGYHGKDCDRPGGCTERLNRDELRAEQRAACRKFYGVDA